MNKLFVVFSKSLNQPIKVLKTKSYARGLIKKNSLLEMKQFGDQIEVEMFIKELEKRNEIEQSIIQQKKKLKEFGQRVTNYNQNSYPEYLDFNYGKNDDKQELEKRQQKPFKLQQKEQQIGLIEKYVVPKIELMRHFKPSPAFQSLTTFSPTININIRQNQNPGLTQINYYLQNSSSPSDSYMIGQKFKHQAQLIGTLYALTDLRLNNHKKANICLQNDYVLKLLQTKRTFDDKLEPILTEFNKISPLFDSICYNKINNRKYPEKLIFNKKVYY